jgi:hypothetical protein
MSKKYVVRVDSGTFPLSDYPQAQLEFFDFCGYSQEEQVDYLQEMNDTPETALDLMAREYNNAIVLQEGRGNDRILPCRIIGRAEETLWAGGSRQGNEYYFRACGVDSDFDKRHDWLGANAKGSYAISWRREDRARYVYFVAFMDEADDQAFLAAFPEAGE